MSRLVESIKILNGRIYNLPFHQERFNRTRFEAIGVTKKILLQNIIRDAGPPNQGLYKCRILYDEKIHGIEFIPYNKPVIRLLKVLDAPGISYDFKWEERSALDTLYAMRGEADEIILVRDGLVTDGYYFNYVFEKNGIFLTPDQPLLAGTQRARLWQHGKIQTAEIKIQDLFQYDFIHAINAMNPLGNIRIPISQISR